MTLKSLLAAGALALVLTGPAGATTLVAWDLLGAPGNQPTTVATTVAPQLTGLDLTRGPGLGASAAANSFSSNGWSGSDAGDYISFGFTVDPGFAVNLDELIIGTRSSNTGPGTIGLYSNLDGFASPLASWSQAGTAFANTIVDLGTLVGLTGAVEFRLFEIGDTQADGVGATSATGTFRIADYSPDGGATFIDTQLTGTVVPVPAAAWFFASALALLGAVRARARA